MKLFDKNNTLSIRMYVWDGERWTQDISNDFYAGAEYVRERDAYEVPDVDYCLDQALNWQFRRGDFADDDTEEVRAVFHD